MRFTRVVFVLSVLALVLAPIAAAMRFTDASRLPPQGFTGSPYHHKVERARCHDVLPHFQIIR